MNAAQTKQDTVTITQVALDYFESQHVPRLTQMEYNIDGDKRLVTPRKDVKLLDVSDGTASLSC